MSSDDAADGVRAALPIRGRGEELALVDDLIAKLIDDTGFLLVIEGPAGIGKSRLLAEIQRRLAAAGARSLPGKAFEDQQAVPFSLLFGALVDVDPPIADVDALRTLGVGAEGRYWVVRDLAAAIAAAARETPLAVIVDDAHWADTGSLVALRALTESLATAPVAWVLATRSGDTRPVVRDAIDDMVLAQGQRARRIQLGTVTDEAAADIARDALGADLDHVLMWMTRMARGNPFLLLELLRGLWDEDRIRIDRGRAAAAGDQVPRRLEDTVERRLNRLSPDARRVVQMAAVLPENFSVNILAHMVGKTTPSLVESVGEAVRADLLTEEGDRMKFRHDLLRYAARQTIPLSLRRALERESASVLLSAGAAPEEVAIQMARSADVDDQEAIATLRRAAQSVSRWDPPTAADLSERALRLVRSDDAQRSVVVAETISLMNRALRFDTAHQLFTVALSAALDQEEEARIRLSMSIYSGQGPGRRGHQNHLALQVPGLSPGLRAQHLGWLAYNSSMEGQSSVAGTIAPEALRAAGLVSDTQVSILAKIAQANIDSAEGFLMRSLRTLSELEALTRTEDLGVVGQLVTFHRANLAIMAGRFSEAARGINEGLDSARRSDDTTFIRSYSQLDALRAVAEGKLAEARSVSESMPGGVDFADNGAAGLLHGIVLSQLAARLEDQTLSSASDKVARYLLGRGPARRTAAHVALALATWQAGNGEHAAELLGGVSLGVTPPFATHLDDVVLAARVAVDADDAHLRGHVASVVERFDRESDGAALLTGVAAHVRGLLEGDHDRLTSAVTVLAGCERPLLHAAAAEDLGRVLFEMGDHVRAAERLNTAFDVFVRCESTKDARRVGRVLAAMGVERRIGRRRVRTGWDSLTRTELRVVELVVDGATNRQVADQLWLSQHTVNTHLRNIFTKLAIRSRGDLRRTAARQRTEAADSSDRR